MYGVGNRRSPTMEEGQAYTPRYRPAYELSLQFPQCSNRERELAEDISDQIISLLQGQIEVEPAADQYADNLSYFVDIGHGELKATSIPIPQKKKHLLRHLRIRLKGFRINELHDVHDQLSHSL